MGSLDLASQVVNDPTRKWTRQSPASFDTLAYLRSHAPIQLPESYFAFLMQSNGGEGEFGLQPGWFRVWSAEQVLELNAGYKVSQYLAGFFAFGSSGGGELFVFDTRNGEPFRVLAVPVIGMWELEYALKIGVGFESFVEQIGRLWAQAQAPNS